MMGDVERIHLALDTDKWQFAINTVMNFRVQENWGRRGGGVLDWLKNCGLLRKDFLIHGVSWLVNWLYS